MTKVRDIGEQGLLSKLQRFCPPGVVGDDAAVLTITPGKSLVVTTDVLVDGVHFSDRTTSAPQVGWRSVTANLSDLAAMGASPLGITVGLSLEGETPVSWVEALYQGMSDCLSLYNTPIVGGDICASRVNTVAITALGEVASDRAFTRFQAKPGDVILITGYHGASRAGLECLLHPEIATILPPEAKKYLLKAHQQPLPRLEVIPPLRDILPETTITAMDSSDGLADAILQICRCSGVGAEIDLQLLPILPILEQYFPSQALNWTLYGGEDFELVLCLPEKAAQKVQQFLGKPSKIIGRITQGNQVKLINSGNNNYTRILNLKEGFQHF
ncbi:MAG: thiamine-phosphate kinase [Gloeocapsa sp. DLM2.Bin57]|nr:MAG: thiamine-phosphate kinase [Gloeocapsa sp. DLM2.Bin57]